uniref:Pco095363 n=1 Tax=Arundo donax TaxID=35708 RepID=A0A0A9DZX7_ARUDO
MIGSSRHQYHHPMGHSGSNTSPCCAQHQGCPLSPGNNPQTCGMRPSSPGPSCKMPPPRHPRGGYQYPHKERARGT